MLVELLVLLASEVSTPSPEPLPVIGGNVAQACEWPSTVLLSGCSGTLIHPEIVLYAAHCPNTGSVRFGTTGGERTVATEYCRAAPEYPQLGFDYAYCKLAEPVTDVPIVPVLMGCERSQLAVGTRVTLVGFGNTQNGGGGFGTKRWIEGDVAGFPNDGRQIGIFYDDPETGICNGDSGGSAYVQLEDGSWRMFAIASTVPGSCGGSSQHVPAWAAVEWIETDSGIDVTPCHDGDGTWNPTADCGGFPLAPDDEEGLTWATGCGPGMRGGLSNTCGPTVEEAPDETPPVLSIVTPVEGAYPGPAFQTSIELMVTDDGLVRDVSLSFNGEEQAVLEAEPFSIATVSFPEGSWELTARARDWSGNETEQTIRIDVGEVSSESGDAETSGGTTGDDEGSQGDASSGSGGDGETSGGTGGTPDGEDPASASGSDGCRLGGSGATGLPLLLVVLATRRRRRAAQS